MEVVRKFDDLVVAAGTIFATFAWVCHWAVSIARNCVNNQTYLARSRLSDRPVVPQSLVHSPAMVDNPPPRSAVVASRPGYAGHSAHAQGVRGAPRTVRH